MPPVIEFHEEPDHYDDCGEGSAAGDCPEYLRRLYPDNERHGEIQGQLPGEAELDAEVNSFFAGPSAVTPPDVRTSGAFGGVGVSHWYRSLLYPRAPRADLRCASQDLQE